MHEFLERMTRLNELLQTCYYTLVVFLCLAMSAGIQAQDPITWSITSNEGLPSNIIYRITQDNQGRTWMATDNGMCYFDGSKVIRPAMPKVNDNFFAYMDRDKFGHIWMLNISGELLVFVKGIIEERTSYFNDSGSYIHEIYVFEDYMWVVLKNDERKSHVQIFKIVENAELQLVNDDLLELQSRSLVVSRFNSNVYLSYFDLNVRENRLKIFDVDGSNKNLRMNLDQAFADIVESESNLLATDQDRTTLFLFDEQKIYDQIEFDTKINKLLKISDNYFLLTNNGYYEVFIQGKSISLSRPYLQELKINSIFLGRENLYWFGTYNRGAKVMPSRKNTLYNLSTKENRESTITKIVESDSIILVGTSNGELLKLENESLQEVARLKGKITAIASQNNDFIVGTSVGAYLYDDDFSEKQFLLQRVIKDIDISKKSEEIFISSGVAAEIFDKQNSKMVKTGGVEINERSYACKFDRQDAIWIGTVRGLYVIKNYNSNSKESYDVDLPYNISDIVQLNDTTMYVSTFSNGAYKFVNYQQKSKLDLPSFTIVDMATDGQNLLFATDQGALYYDIANDDYFPITNKNYISSNDVHSVFLSDDWLWIGTDAGLNKISNTSFGMDKDIILSLNTIQLDQETVSPQEELKIDKDVNTILFQYKGISNKNYREITYRYRVIGLDEDWVTTNSDEIYLRKIDPGGYTLELSASDGRSESNVVTQNFRIEPAWIDHMWVKLILTLLLAFGVYTFVKYLLAKRLHEERTRTEKQKKMDGMQMTALQNHMNPHFISNALYTIHDLIKQEKNWEASEFTANFAGLIRKSMQYASKERISLTEELDFLKMYMELESSRFDVPVYTNISLDDLSQERKSNIYIPPLLIQPLIENSFKHGDLVHRKDPQVTVNLRIENDNLVVKVCDNGLGFNKESLNSKDSTGLKTLKERLAINTSQLEKEKIDDQIKIMPSENGRCCITLIISYIDKYDA